MAVGQGSGSALTSVANEWQHSLVEAGSDTDVENVPPRGLTLIISLRSEPRLIHNAAMTPLTNPKIRELKARGQLMKPTLKVGHEGLSGQFIAALDDALKHHDLVKVKFSYFKEQKKELAPQLAEKTASQLIMRVGNVAVLYRAKPAGAANAAENQKE